MSKTQKKYWPDMNTSDFHPPRIAVLTSHSATGIEGLVGDPNRGTLYNLVAVVSSESRIAEQEIIDAAGIPTILRPIQRFHDERRVALRLVQNRSAYDAETADILHRLDVNYVILLGYRFIVTEPLLAAFPQRIIALHDGDLTLRDEDGRRSYTGLHAVRNAVFDGLGETRCSAYLATRDVGAGPLFLLSGAYPLAAMAVDAQLWGALDVLSSYAALHGRWMRRSAWSTMLIHIMEMLSAGTMQVVGDVVWVDGVPGPCRMGDAPSVCHAREKSITAGVPASCPFISG